MALLFSQNAPSWMFDRVPKTPQQSITFRSYIMLSFFFCSHLSISHKDNSLVLYYRLFSATQNPDFLLHDYQDNIFHFESSQPYAENILIFFARNCLSDSASHLFHKEKIAV